MTDWLHDPHDPAPLPVIIAGFLNPCTTWIIGTGIAIDLTLRILKPFQRIEVQAGDRTYRMRPEEWARRWEGE